MSFLSSDKYVLVNEPPHDKTNKVTVHPAKTQISLCICPVWSGFAVRMKKAWALSYPLSAQRRHWSDWAGAQADLSFCWAPQSFCWFCHVAAQLLNMVCTDDSGEQTGQKALTGAGFTRISTMCTFLQWRTLVRHCCVGNKAQSDN